jgi:hypothetical protein
MGSLTINGVGTELQRKLAALAAERGSSVPQEALRVIAGALQVHPTDDSNSSPATDSGNPGLRTGAKVVAEIRALAEKFGGWDDIDFRRVRTKARAPRFR